jgi:hypothetical protein
MNKKCGCGNPISDERFELGFKICLNCGEKAAQRKKPYGYIHFGHKTAGSIVVTTKSGFDNYSKVSYRKNKGSHMGYASRLTTSF